MIYETRPINVNHMNQRQKDLTFNGFESAGITEAVEKCSDISNREENPFRAL